MVDTGHQSVVLAFCILTVNHICSEKILCSFILFLSTTGSVGSFSTVASYCFFTQNTRFRIFFCKILVTFFYSITHSLKCLADEHPFVSWIHFTGTGGHLYIGCVSLARFRLQQCWHNSCVIWDPYRSQTYFFEAQRHDTCTSLWIPKYLCF